MSVLNRKPFISSVLEGLSEENQVKLGNLLNGQGNQTQLQRILGLASGMRTPITEADKGAHLCSLQIGPTLYEGYLLYTDDVCCLVWFTDFQALSMFNIDVVNQKFAVVSEYLDVNELRYTLNDLLIESGHAVKIQADDVDSGAATQGQVLVADGTGGASWGDAGGGELTGEILSFEYQGTDTLDSLVEDLGLDTNTQSSFVLRIRVFRGSPTDLIGFFNFQYEGMGYGLYAYVFKDLTVQDGFKKAYCYASTGLSNVTWASFIDSLAAVGGGTQLYKHSVQFTYNSTTYKIDVITNDDTALSFTDSGGPYRLSGNGSIVSYLDRANTKDKVSVYSDKELCFDGISSSSNFSDTVTTL